MDAFIVDRLSWITLLQLQEKMCVCVMRYFVRCRWSLKVRFLLPVPEPLENIIRAPLKKKNIWVNCKVVVSMSILTSITAAWARIVSKAWCKPRLNFDTSLSYKMSVSFKNRITRSFDTNLEEFFDIFRVGLSAKIFEWILIAKVRQTVSAWHYTSTYRNQGR